MAPPVSKQLQCSYCTKQFGRTEHLKRHELIHTTGREFTCGECGKGFQRRDALHRHELTHKASGPSLLSQGARACTGCAVAKTRCSGGLPCSRCRQREQQCVYPELTGEQQSLTQDTGTGSRGMDSADSISSNVNVQQFVFNPVPSDISMPFGPPTFDSDFWDPNILSTTNWLDAVIEDDFSGMQFDFDINDNTAGAATVQTRALDGNNVWDSSHTAGRLRSRGHIDSPVAVASNNSAQSAVSTETAADICAAQEDPAHSVGEYYVDGEPARLPRTKRRKLSSNQHTDRSHTSHTSNFSLHLDLSLDDDSKHRIHISDPIYEQFYNTWQMTCVDTRSVWPAFEASTFPAKEIFEHLLGLYFAQFHQTLPFVHPPSFDVSATHWLLVIGMTSIGAHYLDEGGHIFTSSLAELFRRATMYEKERSQFNTAHLTLAQIQLLLAVSLVFSGDERLTIRGLDMQYSLSSSFNHLSEEYASIPEDQLESADTKWQNWILGEQRRRTAYSVWLLDCILSYQFQKRPMLALSDATLGLPCNEKLWRTTNAQEWEALGPNLTRTPTLKDALQEIYIDKRLSKDRGEFARIIMIHGLFQRSWEVDRWNSNPLSHWEPTAKKQSSEDVLPQEPVSLLSVPSYTKWQNSVCDCIDILHWQANATIGQASGLEHPTVAFLHLSRIVLLSPIDTIVRYAKALAIKDTGTVSNLSTDKKIIHRWASQGQYKARLAAIHAGVVFWHIRRYSIEGFYEAPSVALACLMLWAFGAFAPRQTSKQQSHTTNGRSTTQQEMDRSRSSTEDSDDSACGIILLDRPADDELVQQFIRRGHAMRAHMTGVGDLYGPQGPRRVLLEGCKLLRSLKCWGINETWLNVLQRLHQSCTNVSNE